MVESMSGRGREYHFDCYLQYDYLCVSVEAVMEVETLTENLKRCSAAVDARCFTPVWLYSAADSARHWEPFLGPACKGSANHILGHSKEFTSLISKLTLTLT